MSYKPTGLDWGDIEDAGAAVFPFVDPTRAAKVYGGILPSGITDPLKDVICSVAPYGGAGAATGPQGAVIGAGVSIAGNLVCNTNKGGNTLTPEQVALLQAQQQQVQTQKMILIGGAAIIGILLLSLAIN